MDTGTTWPTRPGGKITLVVFLILVASLAVPPAYGPAPFWLAGFVIVMEAVRWLHRCVTVGTERKTVFADVAALGYAGLFAWHILTAHLKWLDAMFFPAPETIVRLFWHEVPGLVAGAGGSLVKLFTGFGIALATGILLGLLIGWNKRLSHAVAPIAKALGPIPPVIYIPYAICFLPNLRWAQVFVIFIGAFWPVFLSTLSGIRNITRAHIEAARTLALGHRDMILRVILPGALPSICGGAVLGLVFSFILLTAAELIGSSSGVGWYIKNHADFGDFSRVLVGIAFVGVLVLAVTSVTDRIERSLIAWCE